MTDPDDYSLVRPIILTRKTHALTFELDANGYPINPFEETNKTGRGILPYYGPNQVIVLVITRYCSPTHVNFVVVDNTPGVLPGDLLEHGESVKQVIEREYFDIFHVAIEEMPLSPYIVHCEYIYGDQRNTNWSWIEYNYVHIHVNTPLETSTEYKWKAGFRLKSNLQKSVLDFIRYYHHC